MILDKIGGLPHTQQHADDTGQGAARAYPHRRATGQEAVVNVAGSVFRVGASPETSPERTGSDRGADELSLYPERDSNPHGREGHKILSLASGRSEPRQIAAARVTSEQGYGHERAELRPNADRQSPDMSPDPSPTSRRITTACAACGTPFTVAPWQVRAGRRFCSVVCSKPARGRRGPANGRWKGGRRAHALGYVLVNLGPELGERLEHRLVMEQHIGRPLRSDEHVHHRNGIKNDNRIENLELLTRQQHIELHAMERRGQRSPASWATVSCLRCGIAFQRLRKWVEAHPLTYCSRRCFVGSKRPAVSGAAI